MLWYSITADLLPPLVPEIRCKNTRAEFRRHRNADADFVKGFLAEWSSYCDVIQTQLDHDAGLVGRELDPSLRHSLSDEQVQQLEKLRESVVEEAEPLAPRGQG